MSAGKKITDSEKKTIRLPLAGVPNWRDTTKTTDQRYINVYLETIKHGQTEIKYLNKRPGLIPNLSYGPQSAATARGMYYWAPENAAGNGVYSAWGTKVYKNTTDLGITLALTSGLCFFTESQDGTYLYVGDGISIYRIDVFGVVTTINSGTAANFPTGFNGMLQFDGYMVLSQSSGKIWNSSINDPTTWGALDFLTAESYPDPLVGLAQQNDVVLAFGTTSVQMFYDAGTASPGSFMADLAQTTIQLGCAGSGTIAQQENTVIWVAQAQTGGYTVQKLDGVSNLERISTESVEKVLDLEGIALGNAKGYILRSSGHIFYILTLITANLTFVYDLEEKRWDIWQSGGTGRFTYVDVTQNGAFNPNYSALVQHENNGFIYTVSPAKYQDDTTPIEITIRTANQDDGMNNRKFCSRLSLIADRYTSSNPVTVTYSNDDYQTFSTGRVIDLAYSSTNVSINRYAWGQYRRRAWNLFHNANMPLRMEALEYDVQAGEQ